MKVSSIDFSILKLIKDVKKVYLLNYQMNKAYDISII